MTATIGALPEPSEPGTVLTSVPLLAPTGDPVVDALNALATALNRIADELDMLRNKHFGVA